MKSILLVKKFLGLVEMTSGLVNASFSLPEWQAVKMIFFAPWLEVILERASVCAPSLKISGFDDQLCLVFVFQILFNHLGCFESLNCKDHNSLTYSSTILIYINNNIIPYNKSI